MYDQYDDGHEDVRFMREKSPVQKEFLRMYRSGVVFTCEGQSLKGHGRTFPLEMVRSLNAKPHVTNYNEFMYEMNKY